MDAHLQEIYDSTPLDEPRSKLEPYRELILSWRRQKRTYRRIQELLREKCGVRVSPQALHQFVRRRGRSRQQVDSEAELQVAGPITAEKSPETDIERKPGWRVSFECGEDAALHMHFLPGDERCMDARHSKQRSSETEQGQCLSHLC
jgi:hypothetical protein